MNAAMLGQTGGSQPHGNIQPHLAVTYGIATEGIFPSRG
jgi:microcystin-dependent protein